MVTKTVQRRRSGKDHRENILVIFVAKQLDTTKISFNENVLLEGRTKHCSI
jgi:hypothetical protein